MATTPEVSPERPVTTPFIERCGLRGSLFKLIDKLWLQRDSSFPMHRICTMMRQMGVQSAVVEALNEPEQTSGPKNSAEWDRVREELRALRTRLGSRGLASQPVVTKVTFIDRDCSSVNDALKLTDEHFLGYLILINIKLRGNLNRSYVFESVVREFGSGLAPTSLDPEFPPNASSFLHVKRSFAGTLRKENQHYRIIGTFFCQQNSITSACAHACTAMMLNNSLEEGHPIVTCEALNKLLGIDHRRRMQQLPEGYGTNDLSTHEGLYPKEISRVLRHFGFTPYQLDLTKANRRYYREFLYSFIESGYPALLSFSNCRPNGELEMHVVSVVGHTLNRHSWFPAAYATYAGHLANDKHYLSSLSWVDDFIVHDDNFGMQLCLPAQSFRPEDYPDPGITFMPSDAIGIFPSSKGIKALGYHAERVAYDVLRGSFSVMEADEHLHGNYYVKHLSPHITGAQHTAVLRTLLVDTKAYLKQIASDDSMGRRYSSVSLSKLAQVLTQHDTVWLTEVSEPDLYVGNTAKVIDVFLDPQFQLSLDPRDSRRSRKAVIGIRFPNAVARNSPTDLNEVSLHCESLEHVEGHMPLFSLNGSAARKATNQ